MEDPRTRVAVRPAFVDSGWLHEEWQRELSSPGTRVSVAVVQVRALPGALPGVVPASRKRPPLPPPPEAADEETRNQVSRLEAVREVLRDYARTSTLHGIGFIGNERISTAERVMWLLAVLVFGSLMCYLCCFEWLTYKAAPTVIKIQNNDLPTNTFPFPAVTVCPVSNINVSVLEKILQRYVSSLVDPRNASSFSNPALTNRSSWESLVHSVSETLGNYNLLKFRQMKPGLRSIGTFIRFLDGFVISRAMMKARVSCTDLMADCSWRGVSFSCCEQFQLQRTDMGYCMSFNSRTSIGPKKLCPERNCHHVWSTGPGTGLVMSFKATTSANSSFVDKIIRNFDRFMTTNDRYTNKTGFKKQTAASVWMDELKFLIAQTLAERNSIAVAIHNRQLLPDVSKMFVLSNQQNTDYSVAISYEGIVAAEELRSLKPEERGCLLDGEMNLKMSRAYSSHGCIASCRLRHILDKCGCHPYYVPLRGSSECRFSQLPCLSGLRLGALQCNHCLPACTAAEYTGRISPLISGRVLPNSNRGSIIEISYDVYRTAVLLKRQVAMDTNEMLISFGGLVSLFLGCSILTGLDILHALLRVLKAAIGYKVKPIYHQTSKPVILKECMFY